MPLNLYLGLKFKVIKKSFVVKIEVCGKNALILNISKNTKENILRNTILIIYLLSFLDSLSVCPNILDYGR